MQFLRNAHLITRLVLVWFALFIGVSVASPLVKPQATQMVFVPVSALAHALRLIPSAHIAWLTGAPLPPRGPPALS